MPDSAKAVTLTSEMTYGTARTLLAEAWPGLPIFIYEPTIEHYKEGRPTEEELELGPDETLARAPAGGRSCAGT